MLSHLKSGSEHRLSYGQTAPNILSDVQMAIVWMTGCAKFPKLLNIYYNHFSMKENRAFKPLYMRPAAPKLIWAHMH